MGYRLLLTGFRLGVITITRKGVRSQLRNSYLDYLIRKGFVRSEQ